MKSGYHISRELNQREQARHGDVFLPVNSYHCLVPESYTELALHWHEEMEITLIREGESDYRVGQERFRACEGDLLIIPPVTLHAATEIPGHRMLSDSLVFHPSYLGTSGSDLSAARYLRPLAQGQLEAPVCIRAASHGYAEIRDSFLAALDCFLEKQPFFELLLKAQLLRTLYLLFSSGHIRERDGGNIRSESGLELQRVLKYIDEHYQERLTIGQLAEISGFSESYFMNFFKNTVGMSCVNYINHVRIQKAAQCLESTRQPVMDIALDCGFNNISYFNRQFLRQFSMTPRQFREKALSS